MQDRDMRPLMPGGAGSAQAEEQQNHWERQLGSRPHMFGAHASEPGRYACAELTRRGAREVLELGAGQGRDTLALAAAGLRVLALDYAEAGVRAIRQAADDALAHCGPLPDTTCGTPSGRAAPGAPNAPHASGLAALRVVHHDVRRPLPLEDNAVDACYAHMLLCMALTQDELRALCAEVRRVLHPGGLFIYTVRHEADPHYGAGTHGGENMYASGGFMVHYFNRAMVDTLAQGFTLLDVHAFEEGTLPRRLWRVSMEKTA